LKTRTIIDRMGFMGCWGILPSASQAARAKPAPCHRSFTLVFPTPEGRWTPPTDRNGNTDMDMDASARIFHLAAPPQRQGNLRANHKRTTGWTGFTGWIQPSPTGAMHSVQRIQTAPHPAHPVHPVEKFRAFFHTPGRKCPNQLAHRMPCRASGALPSCQPRPAGALDSSLTAKSRFVAQFSEC
jgi:hypothetical protein